MPATCGHVYAHTMFAEVVAVGLMAGGSVQGTERRERHPQHDNHDGNHEHVPRTRLIAAATASNSLESVTVVRMSAAPDDFEHIRDATSGSITKNLTAFYTNSPRPLGW